MRIQHNIMAMNAYRNYTNNVSAMKKNLEKLSSGYKINRAGDDAAGLAISEKMRAQITGLETAQKNAKDGISLVQTAEGALTEVHDMLNRMVELATQSANGTYDNTTDRYQLQKEMDQLRTEINRIADSSNFNGIKLLDGSLQDKAATSTKVNITGMDRMLSDVIAKGEKPYEVQGQKTVLDAGSNSAAVKTKIRLDFNGVSGSIAGTLSQTDANTLAIDISIGDLSKTITIKGDKSADGTTASAAKSVNATTIATHVLNVLKGSTDGGATAGTDTTVTIDGIDYTIGAVSDGGLELTMVNDPVTEAETRGNHDVKFSMNNGSSATSVLNGSHTVGTQVTTGAVAGSAQRANTVFKINEDDIRDGAYIKIGDKAVTLKVGAASTMAAVTGSTLVDLTEMEEGDIDLNKALSKISQAFGTAAVTDANAKNAAGATVAATIKVGVSDTAKGYPAGLTIQRNDNVADAVYTTKEKLSELFSMSYTKNTAATSALTLQIGDTADDFNQLKVNISDMHTNSMGIDGISVADQASAAKAMDTIKAAINFVSDVRGTLGATQNRLDHTINNLGVMTENIQDAESTIRDVDVAEEMMAYTKNNILIQSAQAMLAQANQVPQGVLQLLG